MTLDQFMEEFRKVAYAFHVRPNGEIRTRSNQCPIERVGHVKAGGWMYVSDALNLLATPILRAADDDGEPVLRRRMLAAMRAAKRRRAS